MALTKEDLQAIGALMETNIAKLDERFTGLEASVIGLEADMADMKTEIADLKTDMANSKTDIADLKETMQSVRDFQVIVENEWFRKIDVALDEVIDWNRKNKDNEKRISVVENKVETHSIRIGSLERIAKAK
ncbi:MAG: hypothetical protein LBB91_03055 [Clostridiales bacterium]|jgi:chromosome segregation ATPase|nr:hypothetical protein [Clostridiales bacterium]